MNLLWRFNCICCYNKEVSDRLVEPGLCKLATRALFIDEHNWPMSLVFCGSFCRENFSTQIQMVGSGSIGSVKAKGLSHNAKCF